MTPPDTRVTALRNTTPGGAIYTFGEGTYVGDKVPDIEPFRSAGWPNPCIELDGGGLVWGFQCWWGPVDAVDREYAGRPRIVVQPDPIVRVYEPETP